MSNPSIKGQSPRPSPATAAESVDSSQRQSSEPVPKGDGSSSDDEQTSTAAKTRVTAKSTSTNDVPFRSAVASQLAPSSQSGHHSPSYPEPTQASSLLPPPDFKPFFTLIEDPETGEHHHPAVHYIFADDEPEFLTDATLMALEQQQHQQQQEQEQTPTSQASEVEERLILLDLAEDGKTVLSTTSLSPNWQALKASVGKAPSLGQSEEEGSGGGNPMLTISGQEGSRASPAGSGGKKGGRMKVGAAAGGGAGEGRVEDLVRGFEERLGGLDEVLGEKKEREGADFEKPAEQGIKEGKC
ncbi:hypothetical protein KC340_g5509 [Hortaea werneckii]|nr:hypothetical protein KC342_g11716 [Hortaea werneckii]KAI7082046.1 hypothetical protein KC339_g13232 [Hortaea werneckii]KAI7242545.1 hypothetical protein KC365_g3057 [Hortaea werneckii]KAI7327643.1 hypothetical protein KC340_g5509 [Hortaea werneckii]KAI7404137.1 hypothetical protein KC328_g2040 [Hortaea werneckii]